MKIENLKQAKYLYSEHSKLSEELAKIKLIREAEYGLVISVKLNSAFNDLQVNAEIDFSNKILNTIEIEIKTKIEKIEYIAKQL